MAGLGQSGPDVSRRYEAIVQTYEQLAEMVLNAMRLEIRCRVICNTGASLRSRKVNRAVRLYGLRSADAKQGDFRLDSEALEPDPDIFDLSSSLTESDELAASTLCDDDQRFAVTVLSSVILLF